MFNLINIFKHLKTVCTHKYYVGKYCFKFGLYKQGILHDISKFNPVEFITSCKYYQGIGSPIEVEKLYKGYSIAWLHHFHRNKHHWSFWIDFDKKQKMVAYRMPYKYVIESIADMIGAGTTYSKNSNLEYKYSDTFEYYKNNIRINNKVSSKIFHPQTRQLFDTILTDLKENGIEYITENIRKGTYKKIYDTTKTGNGKYLMYEPIKYKKLLETYFN